MKKVFKEYINITFGVLLLSVGYYFFYLPTGLVAGGTSGIGIIVKDLIPFDVSIFILILNVIILIIGLILLGKDFFIKTAYTSILYPLVLFLFGKVFDKNFFFQKQTYNPYFVAAIAGGVLYGIGVGICFRNRGTTGGTDVLQKILTKYFYVPYSVAMYLTDVVIIVIGGLVIKGGLAFETEKVVVGILTVIFVGYLVDFIALNAKSRRTAYIITKKPEEVKKFIYKIINRGVTECQVKGGYSGEEKSMLICTLDKNESYKLNAHINSVDPDAFSFMSKTKEVTGRYDS